MSQTLIQFALIAAGGAVGGIGRVAVASAFDRRTGARFPWGTLVVNVTGSAAIGVGWALSAGGGMLADALFVGVIGSFTTVSTFALQTLSLGQSGRVGAAIANAGLSVGLCLIAAAAGLKIGSLMIGGP
ncbi:CrcB family protein [Fodinicurvata sp. EGI_FJ10296]|uniref:fluoride efflux transporter FluC n=1 Tax=Fodinicurvata sp. EGI_FJ10296 TaxID=3231908 RepID=UPI003452D1CE